MWKNLKVFLVLAMFFQWMSETAYRLKNISVENNIKHCHYKLCLWNTAYWGAESVYPLLPCLKTPKKAISWQKLIIIHLFKVPIKIPWFCHNGLSFCLSHFIYFLYNFSTFNISSKRFTSKSVSLHNSFAIKIPHTFFSQFAPIFCTYLALIGLFPYNPLKYQMNKLLELDGRQLKLKFTACVAAI